MVALCVLCTERERERGGGERGGGGGQCTVLGVVWRYGRTTAGPDPDSSGRWSVSVRGPAG